MLQLQRAARGRSARCCCSADRLPASELLEKARAEGHEFEILAKPVHPSDLLAELRS